jgi:hypothetical protein
MNTATFPPKPEPAQPHLQNSAEPLATDGWSRQQKAAFWKRVAPPIYDVKVHDYQAGGPLTWD